jgi:Fe-S-cluster containining protein
MGKRDAERARELVRKRIEVAVDAWSYCDQLIERELASLADRGVMSTCAKGCAHCCRQEIRVARAEAEAIVEWINKTWDPEMIASLKGRLQSWMTWYTQDYTRLLVSGGTRGAAFYEHGPQCPALQNDACSIYPVRPMTCRRHHVSSPPDACRQERDPKFLGHDLTRPIEAVVRVTEPATLRIRLAVEAQGADYYASAHLLPEWLLHLLRVEDQPWRRTPPLFD